MKPHADDRIYLLHPEHNHKLHMDWPVHLCPSVKQTWGGGATFRDHLDPCATGSCRYCGQPLPTPETKP